MTSYFIGSQVDGGVNVWWWFPREHVAIGFSLFRVFLLVSKIQLEGGATVVTTGYMMSVK